MKKKTYYKVLVRGRSCHGGDIEYSLPTQRDDGTWEPGEWMPEISGPLELCVNGYHLTSDPARWWQEGAECYVAEWDGEYIGDGHDKIVVRRCRLLRPLTADELAALRVFVEGSHKVSNGIAAASGSARIWASGCAHVWAHGSAKVDASESARIWARDSVHVLARDYAMISAYNSVRVSARGRAQVWARDSARVVAHDTVEVWAPESAQVEAFNSARIEASGSAQVEARDYARVRASGSARVWARESAHVEASGSARVWAFGYAQIWASESARVDAHGSAVVRTPLRASGQPTVVTHDAAVWVDYRGGVPVVHTPEGRCEPVASGG